MPSDIEVHSAHLATMRQLPAIPSGFCTECIYTLTRETRDGGVIWTLQQVQLQQPFVKRYDRGRVDEWLESYLDTAQVSDLKFAIARRKADVLGAITYQLMSWNRTIALWDIRTREQDRHQGVGSALIEYLKEETRRQGYRGIRVETQTNNYPAIQFYRKHGFLIAGFDTHLYANDDLERQDVALYLFWEA